MKQLGLFISILFVAAMLAGCSSKDKAAMPPELASLAQEFKTTACGAAKIELGKKIMPLLPTCTRAGANAGLAVIDFANPTYVLTVPELSALLGQPQETGVDFVAYDLGKGEKVSYYLYIELYDDYVSLCRLDAGK
jgi:hypothetical protein